MLQRALGAATLAALISTAMLPFIRRVALRWGWVAKPRHERWHRRVVTQFGGVAIWAGFIVAAVALGPRTPKFWAVLGGGTALFVLGLLDDFIRIKPYSKVLGQVIVACGLLLAGIRVEIIPWEWVAVLVTIVWFVLLTNAINLLDNMDGLAAGVVAIAACFLAIHGWWGGSAPVLVLSTALAGASIGFLRYNFPPARSFMGDAGSQFLGGTLAAVALMGTWKHTTQLVSVLAIPVLILSVPIFDTVFVTVLRLMNKRRPFQGGTDHISHRLAIMGLTERQVVLSLYGVSLGFGLLSIYCAACRPVTMWVILPLSLIGLLICGAYLAKVKVYQLERLTTDRQAQTSRGQVVIETTLWYKRRIVEVVTDVVLIGVAFVGAHLLRFEGMLSYDLQRLIVQALPVLVVLKITMFYLCGLYRGLWRYASLTDVIAIFKAVSLGSVASAVALVLLWRFIGYSRAVLIIDWLLLFLGVCGTRVAERLLDELITSATVSQRQVVIFGAGDAGELALRKLKQHRLLRPKVVGFVDEDLLKVGQSIHGVPIMGTREQLTELAQVSRIDELIVAVPGLSRQALGEITEQCRLLGIRLRSLSDVLVDE
ncbi:MAG: hypothetical protein HY597_01135 [Candidatus Omnitrophica bacterium]|nr:hypothetical protein [Candidatus Omnitrophota bacterium]